MTPIGSIDMRQKMSVEFKTRPQVEAFDTETLFGYAQLMSSPKSVLRSKSIKKPLTTIDCFDYLCKTMNKSSSQKIGFFFNLGYDVASMMKWWIIEQSKKSMERLQEFRITGEAVIGDFRIFYISGKSLTLINVPWHRRFDFYDIGNLLRGESSFSLESLGQKYLGIGKLRNVKGSRMAGDPNYWKKHQEKIELYSMRDADITRQLAEFFLDNVKDVFGYYPKFYHSKASLSKAWLSTSHPKLRKQFIRLKQDRWTKKFYWASNLGLSNEALTLIFQAFYGGIIDTWTFGTINNVATIDICSAYPYAILNLPKLDNLTAKMTNTYSADAITGFYEVRMQYKSYPLPYRTKRMIVYPGDEVQTIYPESEFSRRYRQYLTKPKLDFLISKGFRFEVVRSIEFFGKFQSEFPDILDLYEKRRHLKRQMNHKDELTARVCQLREFMLKISMNAIYGSMAELVKGVGVFTNIAYAALITSSTHVQIYKLIDQIGRENVITIATDGIIFKDVGQSIQNDDGSYIHINPDQLGHCRKEHEHLTLHIYQNGIYFLKNRRGKVIAFKHRGMPDLEINQLLKAKGHVIKTKITRPVHMFELIARGKSNLLKYINTWQTMNRHLDLRENMKKRWVPEDNIMMYTFEEFNKGEVETMPPVAEGEQEYKELPEPVPSRLMKAAYFQETK
jgi:hypothetical protein